ncbi:MAG: Planctomycete cytochrome [Gemmataceae bacterium]|nr:Planctomycete cytochrome [Gemmataceae bacterium]
MTRAVRTLFLLLIVSPTARAAEPAPVDFARDVVPILSDYCYQCHGPDPKARKAKLRFDDKASPFDRGVIVPGKPTQSELIARVTSTDPESVMPPPGLKRALSAQQVDTLKRWVEQGAKWGTHWAFSPVRAPVVPEIRTPKFEIRNPIDAFVADRLIREGLVQSPPADKERLLRRVTFDLTGLPPTPAEVDAFLADLSPAAYEKVVDQLLASPRYGERMAGEWLDVARFADTHGYQMDRTRPVWPYRDWVITAFNRNLPVNEFVTWQLAGDLLPNPTKEQRLATAFNRLHMQNEEGGIVEEEFRVAYVIDRVTTFGTAFLGLTFECSRCHDHKYDPVTMKDFYSLFAFFQNIDESGQTSYFTAATPVPALLLTSADQDRKIADLRAAVAARQAAPAKSREMARDEFAKWRTKRPAKLDVAGLVAAYSFDELKGGTVANAADPKTPGTAVEGPKLVPGKMGQAAELSGENGFVFPNVGHFTRDDPFTLSLWLKAPVHTPRAVVVHHSMAPVDAGSRGYELLLENGKVAVGLHHMWPGNSLKVVTKAAIPVNAWTHVTATYDGSSTAAGVTVYVDGRPAEVEVVRDKLTKDITYGGEPNLAIGHRFRDNGFKGGAVDEFKVHNRALTAAEVAEAAGLPLTDDALFDYFAAVVHEPTRTAAEKLRTARRALTVFVDPIPEIMVMDELPAPKPAFVLKRGAYDAHGESVSADTPKAMPPFPKDAPRNRLGLAMWLTDPEHPLLARVTVNRAWQLMFGRGLVETADNFGTQGARPTHQELLDWLAREFIRSGWNHKQLLKTIALSATYRQSSKASPELLARDPQNDLLARGPVKRLTAEMLRDGALAAGGLLVEKIGGPSVKPYQPAGLWEEIAMGRPRYDQGKGDDLYRRSFYTFWKRTVPPPAMTTFDAADKSVCTVKRQSTSTPLQALVLLNDVQFVEAARFVGQRMLKEGGKTTEEQVGWAFRLVTGRKPTEKERTVLVKLFAEQKALFEKDPAAAKKLLAVGEKAADTVLPPADLAAAAVLANVLFSHDEAVTRR